MKIKNHHFVPQTYLRSFAQNQKHLWVYDKAEQKSFRRLIRKVAVEENFYDHEALNQALGEQWVEMKFGELESPYTQKLSKLEQNGWVFDGDLKEYFATFFTYQLFRTKAYRERLRNAKEQSVTFLTQQENGQEQICSLHLSPGIIL